MQKPSNNSEMAEVVKIKVMWCAHKLTSSLGDGTFAYRASAPLCSLPISCFDTHIKLGRLNQDVCVSPLGLCFEEKHHSCWIHKKNWQFLTGLRKFSNFFNFEGRKTYKVTLSWQVFRSLNKEKLFWFKLFRKIFEITNCNKR